MVHDFVFSITWLGRELVAIINHEHSLQKMEILRPRSGCTGNSCAFAAPSTSCRVGLLCHSLVFVNLLSLVHRTWNNWCCSSSSVCLCLYSVRASCMSFILPLANQMRDMKTPRSTFDNPSTEPIILPRNLFLRW